MTACVACGSRNLFREWSITSTFFATRALSTDPRVIDFLGCRDCGTRFFCLPLSDAQLARLYAGYRGEDYFRQRHALEPWYTRDVNDGLGGDEEMRKRREALRAALAAAAVANDFRAVLDHGGDRGQMLKDLQASRRATFEISGVTPDAGVESVAEADMRASEWDLILCCHVLEHQISPASYVRDLMTLGRRGTVYYIEVPDESTPATAFNGTSLQRRWLAFLCRRPVLLKLFDFLSTGVRYRLGRVLPLLFLPLREHMNFFTVAGIRRLMADNGCEVLMAGKLATGHIGVVARKRDGGDGGT
jgi:hypothetical protein